MMSPLQGRDVSKWDEEERARLLCHSMAKNPMMRHTHNVGPSGWWRTGIAGEGDKDELVGV